LVISIGPKKAVPVNP